MSEQKIAISEATEAQLRAFAQSHLGIGFPHNAKAETMRARVRSAWSKEEIYIDSPEESTAATGAPPPPGGPDQAPPGPKRVKIIVQRTDDPGGDEPIPVGVNGRVMLIPRGEEVEIPEPYYEVLKHAVTHRYESLKEGGLSEEPRKVPMYPFQRIG